MSDSVVLAPRVLAVASHVSCFQEFTMKLFMNIHFMSRANYNILAGCLRV